MPRVNSEELAGVEASDAACDERCCDGAPPEEASAEAEGSTAPAPAITVVFTKARLEVGIACPSRFFWLSLHGAYRARRISKRVVAVNRLPRTYISSYGQFKLWGKIA